MNLGDEALLFAELLGKELDTEETIAYPDHISPPGESLWRPLSQADLLHQSLETDINGRWVNLTVIDIEPRQNGKGEPLEVRELYGACILGERWVHTAHELPTAKEAFEQAQATVDTDELSHRIKAIRIGNGDWSIQFTDTENAKGGRIEYRARTRASGRGFKQVNGIAWDEAQELQDKHIAPMLSTGAAAQYHQRWMSGTAPEAHSVFWYDQRLNALKARAKRELEGVLYSEHTAEVVKIGDDGNLTFIKPDNEDQRNWYIANPALRAGRIELEFIKEEQRLLTPESFARERLGVATVPKGRQSHGERKITLEDWQACFYDDLEFQGRWVLGIAGDWDLSGVTLYAAGWLPNNHLYVEMLDCYQGSAWLELRLIEILTRSTRPILVAYDSHGPMKTLGPLIETTCKSHGVMHKSVGGTRMQVATSGLERRVKDHEIAHLGDPETVQALDSTEVILKGNSTNWLWREKEGVRTSPVVALTVASWGADFLPKRRSAYEPEEEERES